MALWSATLLVLLAAGLERIEGRPFVATLAGRLLGFALGGSAARGVRAPFALVEVGWLPGLGFRPAGQAWGETVLVVKGQRSPRLLAHEACHVAQFRRYGSFGLWSRYLAQWLAGCLRHRNLYRAYWTMALEREAREAELRGC